MFSAAFDELNFYPIVSNSKRLPEGGTYDEATVLYNRVSRRIRSRMNQRGRLPGHLWLISSARYPTDFTERKKTEALTNKRIFVRDYAAWETRPTSSYMPGRFQVEIGDTTKRSRVLTRYESDVNLDAVLEVPMDFKDAFDKDPEGAVRDYGGISTLAVTPYIVRRDLVAAMFQAGKQAGLKHPFTRETVTLQDSDGQLVVENLPWVDYPTRDAAGRPAVDERGKPVMGRKLFDTKYFAHIDLAKSHDACGIAICYVSRSVKVLRGIAKDQHYEVCPEIRTALLLRVVAPPNGEILVSTVRGVLYKLHELGMEFGKISYDSWGSHESIQTLQLQGYEAEHLSVDTTPQPYATLKEAIYDGRLFCYYVPKLEEELLGLQYDAKKNKIDHRPNGSKDLTDALAGAVYHCSQADLPGTAEAMMPSRGIVDTTEDIWERLARGERITEQRI